MTDSDLQKIFEGEVHTAIKNIKSDLAYLALTSKPEHAVRDAIALSLHRNPKLSGYKIARELHLIEGELQQCHPKDGGAFSKGGIDLAILDPAGEKLKLIAELKAMYSFDMVSKRHEGGGKRTICASMAKGIGHDINQTAHIAAALGIDHAYVMIIVMMPWRKSGQCKEPLHRVARYKMTKAADRIAIGESGHQDRLDACREFLNNANGFALKEGVKCELQNMQANSYGCESAYGIYFTLFPFLMKVSTKTSAPG